MTGIMPYYQEGRAGVIYQGEWMGWRSRERGVNPGDVREIGGILHEAGEIVPEGLLSKPVVYWSPVNPDALLNDPEEKESQAKGREPARLVPCRVCGTHPRVPTPVNGGDHEHHQALCIECGIEVSRLTAQECADTWNRLMEEQ